MRNPIYIQYKERSYIFQVWGLEEWIKSLEETVRNVL